MVKQKKKINGSGFFSRRLRGTTRSSPLNKVSNRVELKKTDLLIQKKSKVKSPSSTPIKNITKLRNIFNEYHNRNMVINFKFLKGHIYIKYLIKEKIEANFIDKKEYIIKLTFEKTDAISSSSLDSIQFSLLLSKIDENITKLTESIDNDKKDKIDKKIKILEDIKEKLNKTYHHLKFILLDTKKNDVISSHFKLRENTNTYTVINNLNYILNNNDNDNDNLFDKEIKTDSTINYVWNMHDGYNIFKIEISENKDYLIKERLYIFIDGILNGDVNDIYQIDPKLSLSQKDKLDLTKTIPCVSLKSAIDQFIEDIDEYKKAHSIKIDNTDWMLLTANRKIDFLNIESDDRYTDSADLGKKSFKRNLLSEVTNYFMLLLRKIDEFINITKLTESTYNDKIVKKKILEDILEIILEQEVYDVEESTEQLNVLNSSWPNSKSSIGGKKPVKKSVVKKPVEKKPVEKKPVKKRNQLINLLRNLSINN